MFILLLYWLCCLLYCIMYKLDTKITLLVDHKLSVLTLNL